MLVLLLGLPRFLVLCTNDAHGSHVEFAHVSGACCEHDHDHGVGGGGDDGGGDDGGHDGDGRGEREPASAPNPLCEHVEWLIDAAPTPRTAADDAPPPAWLGAAPVPRFVRASETRAVVLPPATGPPRRDRRLLLRETTLLLL